jgi:hypothetical protein
MRMAIVVFLTCVRIIGGGAQPAPLNGDDRDVLEAVFEQIQKHDGSPVLHIGRRDSEPIKVVDQARPICRVKRADSEMSWPPQCVEDPLRLLKKPSNDALPEMAPSGWLE